jgi:hypothetical protein
MSYNRFLHLRLSLSADVAEASEFRLGRLSIPAETVVELFRE